MTPGLASISEPELLEKLKKLIDEFKQNRDYFLKAREEETETKLVEPLFELLGWLKEDYEKRVDARRGERRGIADYAFKLNGRIVFFLEVKRVGIPLDREADKQVVSYALSKRVQFAVSTNFEELKIFCVEQRGAIQNKFRVFTSPDEYTSNLANLMLLSKQSFLSGGVLAVAVNEDRLKKRITIDDVLLDDLMRMRSLIANDIEKRYPGKYDLNERDQIVQRIIDRLIFIRRCEDVGINPKGVVLEEVEHLPHDDAYRRLKGIFALYNDVYNSGLFVIGVDSDVDTIKIDGLIIKELVHSLYESKDDHYIYNFDWIDADVLGQVYEQYLGKILLQTKSHKAKLKEDQAHRKEQGIFYTPTYIVDYIVSHTVGEVLKSKNFDSKSIRVLDSACGSGSFLIKAFDEIYSFRKSMQDAPQRKLDAQGMFSIKTEILKKNIFGVDLDNRAVEIAKLNLLLKAAEDGRKLPEELDLHVRRGNSLIEDESRPDLMPFVWEDKFKVILSTGGFDAIIGNPPYVRQEELLPIKEYLEANYDVFNSTADLFVYFFERDIKLLKEGGYLGIIVSNKWLKAGYGLELRRLLKKYWIEQFIDFGDLEIFPDATTYPCIIILRKTEKMNPAIKVCLVKTLDFGTLESYINENSFSFAQKNLDDGGWNFQDRAVSEILSKISKVSTPLKDYVHGEVYRGILTGFGEAFVIDEEEKSRLAKEDSKSLEIIKPFLTGSEVRQYGIRSKNKYIILTKIGVDIKRYPAIFDRLSKFKTQLEKRWDKGNHWYELRACDYYDLFERPKLIYGVITTGPRFTIDKKGFYANNANFFIPTEDKKLLAILNSKLGWFLIKNTCTQVQGGYQLIWKYFGNVPIAKKQSPELVALVDEMLTLIERLNEFGDKKTEESARISDDIKSTGKRIDEIVYGLYGLTGDEIGIIERS